MTVAHPLVDLATDASPMAREALVTATATQFLESNVKQTDKERELYAQILSTLYQHARHEIRHRLSATLAMADWAPPELVRELALDTILVAQPVISFCPTLTDDILVEVIETRDFHHRMCIAERPGIGESVTSKLIDTNNDDLVGAVARNATARIRAADFDRAIEVLRYRQTDLDALITRHDLPPRLIAMAYSLAGTQTRFAIAMRLPPQLEQRLARVTAFVAADAADSHSSAPLAAHLHNKVQARVKANLQRPTPGSLVATLMRGERDEFFERLSHLLELPRQALEAYMSSADPQSVALVARACDFNMTITRTLFETLDTSGRKWSLSDDRLVSLVWMRHSLVSARLQLASSLQANATKAA